MGQKFLGMGVRGKGLFSKSGWEPQPIFASALVGPREGRWRSVWYHAAKNGRLDLSQSCLARQFYAEKEGLEPYY